MSRRRLIVALGVIVVAVAVIPGAIGPRSRVPPRAAATGGRPDVSPVRWRPVAPGEPHTARAVLYRFGTAYGAVSRENVARRYRLLLSLAAPPLLGELRAEGPDADLAAVSAARRGTGIDSLLLRLRVTATSTRGAHGAVAIEQWLTGRDESRDAPLQSSYNARLIRRGGKWRVSQFTLNP